MVWNNFFILWKIWNYFKKIWLRENCFLYFAKLFRLFKKNWNNLNLNFNYSNLNLSFFIFIHYHNFVLINIDYNSWLFIYILNLSSFLSTMESFLLGIEYRKKEKYIEWNMIIKKTSHFLGPACSFRLEASRSAFSIRCTNSSQTPSPCRLLSCLHDASRRTLHASALSDVERRRPLLLICFLFFVSMDKLWIMYEEMSCTFTLFTP